MRCRGRSPLLLCTLVLALAAPAGAQLLPSFDGVGDLGGGAVTSVANDVSADGSVVVGTSESASGSEGFRWTGPGSIQGLGSIGQGGDFFSTAEGVSADGGVIVGTTLDGDSRAYRWSGSLVGLGRFGCFLCPTHAVGIAVSDDGLVVVGSGAGGSVLTPWVQAARWTGGGTGIDGIGWLPGGGTASVANGASFDGGVIVGDSDSSLGTEGFRFTSGSPVVLPGVAGALAMSTAKAVSADGSVIVGGANTSPTTSLDVEAARWVGPGFATAELLGALPGVLVKGGKALDVSDDGTLVVGTTKGFDSLGAVDDVAFLWDPVNGMRELRQVLIDEYGLPVADWELSEARGISDVAPDGSFTIVGAGTNPAGDPEGWVAFLPPVACNDGVDNDGDGDVDFGADLQCIALSDPSEEPDCADGIDNDGDGDVDGADAGCNDAADVSELPDCGDGFDNDGDGHADFPADPGCFDASGLVEDPVCDNGLDDDGDGRTDFPFDLGCVAGDDVSEVEDCKDGLDNDGDGQVDIADADCKNGRDPSEAPQCSDRVDNDGDGLMDFPAEFPECRSASDAIEAPECDDGADNDSDGGIDAADPDCIATGFSREDPAAADVGDLLVVDETGALVFALDPATGAQTLLASGLYLTAPQGVAQRATGEVVVADPAGLVEIDPIYGSQRLAGGPLDAFESLQVVFDAAGDAIVLEHLQLSRHVWSFSAPASSSVLLGVPTPGGELTGFLGFALAREASGDLLVTGLGGGSNGIHRIDPGTGAVTALTAGLNPYVFRDLAVEATGDVLAVGEVLGTAGVYRVHPVTGALAILSQDPAWDTPTGVAVDAAGTVFVADAGAGEIVRVDAASGARTQVWSGGFIQGNLDLAVLAVLPACRNGADDDADADTDYPADRSCPGPSHPSELPACGDGLDNDGDGAIDFGFDPGCASATFRTERPQCSDGVENDGDGLVDFDGAGIGDPDPQCNGNPAANKEKAGCGLGFELAVLLPVLGRWRFRGRSQREAEPGRAV